MSHGIIRNTCHTINKPTTVRVKDNKPEQGRKLKTMYINLSRITEPRIYTYESLLNLPPSVRLLEGEKEQPTKVSIVVENAQ
jgi:hypothetical protein